MTRNEYIEDLTELIEYMKEQITMSAAEKNELLQEFNKEMSIKVLCDISENLKKTSKCLEDIARRMPK